MEENNNKNPVTGPENNENNAPAPQSEHDYYERAYFEGDSLKELENGGENEYLASFDEVSGGSARKKGWSGKKKIILLVSLALAAAVIFALYFLVFRKSETEEDPDSQYYAISQSGLTALEALDKDVTIRFAQTREKLESDPELQYVSFYAQSFEHFVPRINVEYGAGGDFCAVACGGEKVAYGEEDFFGRLENGARYVFYGEQLFGKAALKVAGLPASDESFSVWAMPGYDIDGDVVGSGNRPFVYPKITRSDVEHFVITNSYGSYKVYRARKTDGTLTSEFYFEDSELCSYDQERFASLIVDCTYMLSYGKIREHGDLADYGLASDEDANAIIEVYTVDGAYHKILIGDLVPSGGGFYAKYYTKDFVYLLDTSYASSVMLPAETFLNGTLGYTISQTNDVYSVTDLLIKYFNEDTDIYIARKVDLTVYNADPVNSSQTLASVLHDKTRFSGTYSGWTSDAKTFAGMKAQNASSDIVLELQLTNYADDTGDYAVKFGVVRDSATGAVLPSSAAVSYYDQDNKTWVEAARLDRFEQGDKSYKQYELAFNTEKRVRYIRLTLSGAASGYFVLDEVTSYADGKDAIPNESVAGAWKIVSPESFIQKGYNYAVPDLSAFSDILYKIVSLVGDEVVERSIYRGTEEEVRARLEKYGLDSPNMAISYYFNGYRSYIYASRMFEENGERFFYAYSSISFTDSEGNVVNVSPQIIAKVLYNTASYFDWEPSDLLDRSAFSMYIDKIDTIDMELPDGAYHFDLQDTDGNGKLDTVLCDGEVIDTSSFRALYVSLLECYRAGLYSPAEGDLTDENLILTFTMHSEIKDTEIKFYRVSPAKVIYCTNGEESEFYVLYSDVSNVINNLIKLVNGEPVTK